MAGFRYTHLDLRFDGTRLVGIGPSLVKVPHTRFGIVSLSDKIGIDQIEQILGGIDLDRHHVPKGSQIVSSPHGRSEITRFA